MHGLLDRQLTPFVVRMHPHASIPTSLVRGLVVVHVPAEISLVDFDHVFSTCDVHRRRPLTSVVKLQMNMTFTWDRVGLKASAP